ncbi:MAG: hypothetical protein AB1626_01695 [Candidatus Micrarchaeota archaeon]
MESAKEAAKAAEAKPAKPLVMRKWTVRGTQKAVERHVALAEASEARAKFVEANKERFVKNWPKDLAERAKRTKQETLLAATRHHIVSQAHLVSREVATALVESAIKNYRDQAALHRKYAEAFTRGLEAKLRKKQARGAWYTRIWARIRR